MIKRTQSRKMVHYAKPSYQPQTAIYHYINAKAPCYVPCSTIKKLTQKAPNVYDCCIKNTWGLKAMFCSPKYYYGISTIWWFILKLYSKPLLLFSSPEAYFIVSSLFEFLSYKILRIGTGIQIIRLKKSLQLFQIRSDLNQITREPFCEN